MNNLKQVKNKNPKRLKGGEFYHLVKRTYSRGKHLKEKKSKKSDKKQILLFRMFLFLLLVCIFFLLKIHQKGKEIEVSQQKDFFSNITTSEMNGISGVLKVEMPEEIEGYYVIGELVIEKINFKNYILNKTTDDSLNFSVTKFYGPKVNQQGNLCITGHNTKENLFKNLKDLEKGDTFNIIDKENYENVVYKVYDKYTILPTDLKCLDQDTDKRQVTLITCSPRRVN